MSFPDQIRFLVRSRATPTARWISELVSTFRVAWLVIPTDGTTPVSGDLANGEVVLYNDGNNIQWIKKDSGGNVSTGTLI